VPIPAGNPQGQYAAGQPRSGLDQSSSPALTFWAALLGALMAA
jgi:hypothetical protein